MKRKIINGAKKGKPTLKYKKENEPFFKLAIIYKSGVKAIYESWDQYKERKGLK